MENVVGIFAIMAAAIVVAANILLLEIILRLVEKGTRIDNNYILLFIAS